MNTRQAPNSQLSLRLLLRGALVIGALLTARGPAYAEAGPMCISTICPDGVAAVMEGTLVQATQYITTAHIDKVTCTSTVSWTEGQLLKGLLSPFSSAEFGDRVLIYGFDDDTVSRPLVFEEGVVIACDGDYYFEVPAATLTEAALSDDCQERLEVAGYDEDADRESRIGMCSAAPGRAAGGAAPWFVALPLLLLATRRRVAKRNSSASG